MDAVIMTAIKDNKNLVLLSGSPEQCREETIKRQRVSLWKLERTILPMTSEVEENVVCMAGKVHDS
jgi:hypothetical protein